MTDPCVLRPANEGDRSLIIDSWVRSYADSPIARAIPGYEQSMRGLVSKLINQHPTLVAAWEADPETVFGWACTGFTRYGDAPLVNYVYVKQKFRGRGYARALLQPFLHKPAVYTHLPPHPYPGCKRERFPIPENWTFDAYGFV